MTLLEHELVPYSAEHRFGPGRALVLAPHPDDEVLGCGGAILRHVAAGDPVCVVIVTDGAAAGGTAGDAAAGRMQESRCAAGRLGYGAPVFWGLPDRGLTAGEELIARIGAALDEYAADLVYAPSTWEIHPDHHALALAAAEAVRRGGGARRLLMYEVGAPLQPNRLLDITDLAQRKADAIHCFRSQLALQPYDRQIAALNRYRTYTLPKEVLAAEAYLHGPAEHASVRIVLRVERDVLTGDRGGSRFGRQPG